MITFKEYLAEHYVTTDNSEEKQKHLQHAHDMIRASYKSIGGYSGLGHGSEKESEAIKKDIMDPDVIMKLHRKNNKPHSVMLYKKKHGRKLVAAGTNGTDEGKKSLNKTISADSKEHRAWGEVSHAMEHLYKKHGMPAVHNKHAERLTGKTINHIDDDGEHYSRTIGDKPHVKSIRGYTKESTT
jgi:hypothetical protein